MAVRHALWKSIPDERDVSKEFSRWSDHLTFAGVNESYNSHCFKIAYHCVEQDFAGVNIANTGQSD